jgi:hypothetical protein
MPPVGEPDAALAANSGCYRNTINCIDSQCEIIEKQYSRRNRGFAGMNPDG